MWSKQLQTDNSTAYAEQDFRESCTRATLHKSERKWAYYIKQFGFRPKLSTGIALNGSTPAITSNSIEARLVKLRDHGLHNAFGGCQSCDTMRHDMTFHCFTLLTSPKCNMHTMVSNFYYSCFMEIGGKFQVFSLCYRKRLSFIKKS
jgi:hypothetical protein